MSNKISDVLGLSKEEFFEKWEKYQKEFSEILSNIHTYTDSGEELMEWLKTETYAKCVFLIQHFAMTATLADNALEVIEKAQEQAILLLTLFSALKSDEGRILLDILYQAKKKKGDDNGN